MLAFASGDAATWVLAVGTIGTLLVSLQLLRNAVHDRRRDQARLVSAWETEASEEEDGWALTFLVRNNSEEPIYEVLIRAECGVRGTFVRWLGPLGPTERTQVRILLPGYPRGDYGVSLLFTDASGQLWLRDRRGRLSTRRWEDVGDFTVQDPGGYDSVEDHPTLNLNRPGFELGGTRVDQPSDAA